MEKSSGITSFFKKLTQRGFSEYPDNRGDLQNTHVLLNSMYLLGFLTFFTYFIQLYWQGLYVFACCELVAMIVFATAYYYQKDRFRYSFVHAVYFVLHINMFLYAYYLDMEQIVHLFMGVTVILIVRMFYQFKKWLLLHLAVMFGAQTYCYFFSDPIVTYTKDEWNFFYYFFLGTTMALYVIAMILIMRVWVEKTNMLEQEIDQKEVLLAEVNHRVRNNLNVIVSLINLQKHSVQSEESLKVLENTQSRIYAMAEVHNKLYVSADEIKVDLGEYSSELLEYLCFSYGKKVEIRIKANGLKLLYDQLIPLGLILNELATNSLKHAFDGIENPLIKVHFNCEGSIFQMNYSDNGNGFDSTKISEDDTENIGLSIIELLGEQLSAIAKLDGTNGFNYSIEFEKTKIK